MVSHDTHRYIHSDSMTCTSHSCSSPQISKLQITNYGCYQLWHQLVCLLVDFGWHKRLGFLCLDLKSCIICKAANTTKTICVGAYNF